MDKTQVTTTGFAVLDKYGTPCTAAGMDEFKALIDERYPDEAGRRPEAFMGRLANSPAALAAMLENGTCRYVFVRIGDGIKSLDPAANADFAESLRGADEASTSWDIAVRSMGLDPETED